MQFIWFMGLKGTRKNERLILFTLSYSSFHENRSITDSGVTFFPTEL
jgi:hypothetical protein